MRAPPGSPSPSAALSLGFTSRLYRDADADGFGARGTPVAETWCTPPRGYSKIQGDCADDDAKTHPGAPEACDGRNTDCDANDDTTEAGLCGPSVAGAVCFAHGDTWRCGCGDDVDCPESDTCVDSVCVTGGTGPSDAGRGDSDAGSLVPAGGGADAAAPVPSEAGVPSPPDAPASGSSPTSHDDSSGSCGSCRLTRENSEQGLGVSLVLSSLTLLLALGRRQTTCRNSRDAKGSADAREASLPDSR